MLSRMLYHTRTQKQQQNSQCSPLPPSTSTMSYAKNSMTNPLYMRYTRLSLPVIGATNGRSSMGLSWSMVGCTCHQTHHVFRRFWLAPMAWDMRVLRRRCTASMQISSSPTHARWCTIMCAPAPLARRTRLSNITQLPTAAAACSVRSVVRHCDGFHRRPPAHQRQISDPNDGRSTIQIRALHRAWASVHRNFGCPGFF
jgi:hypothetical protein